MDKYNISHIPVINESGIVTHVVSEKAIIHLLQDNKGSIRYDENSKIKNYLKYFKLTNNEDEFYLFVSKDELVTSLKDKMTRVVDNKQCSLVFVTFSGNEKEKLLGIIGSNELIKE